MNVLQQNKSLQNGLMMASTACARVDVLIFCVLCVLLTLPQMPAKTRFINIRDIELKRVLGLTNLCCNNATRSSLGTSRWGRVRGLCNRNCRPGASVGGGGYRTVTEEQWAPLPPPSWMPIHHVSMPLAESHLFFIPSLFVSSTIDCYAGIGVHGVTPK